MREIRLLGREDIMEEMLSRLKEEDSYDQQEDEDLDDWFERVYENAWVDDYITGNGSGFWPGHDIPEPSLIREALLESGIDLREQGLERIFDTDYINITVRCHLLGEVVAEFIDGF